MEHLVDLAFKLLGPVVVALGGYLAMKLARKLGIDATEKQEAMVDAWIEQGVHLAEERARAAAKRSEAKISGHEKLELAAGYVADLAEKAGWADWTRDRLKAKIDAKLGSARTAPVPATP
jgi:hypothetical protein